MCWVKGNGTSCVKATKKKILSKLKERLEQFCADVSAELPACPFITDDIVIKIGNPVDEVLKLAEKSDCDLLVMGAHGQGIIEGAMMGSVSRRVLRRCKKPVLVVRLPD